MPGTLILDFDSTWVSVETLDVLAELVYGKDPAYARVLQDIQKLTEAAMSGQMSFHQALLERVSLLALRKAHIRACIHYLSQRITPSFIRNRDFIVSRAADILIFSGGFSEIIVPIAAQFNIPAAQVYANRFIYEGDRVAGIEVDNPLAHGDGKIKVLNRIEPTPPVYVIGDGSTDAVIKQSGRVKKFYLFAENVYRPTLAPLADRVIYSLDDFIEDIEKHDKNILS